MDEIDSFYSQRNKETEWNNQPLNCPILLSVDIAIASALLVTRVSGEQFILQLYRLDRAVLAVCSSYTLISAELHWPK